MKIKVKQKSPERSSESGSVKSSTNRRDILQVPNDISDRQAEDLGFGAPRTPDYIEGYDLPPVDPTDVSGQELAERYAYSQAMLACASRMLGMKKAELVILKAKTSHFRKKEMFLAGNSADKKWQAESKLESNPVYEELTFDLMQVEAFCELQQGVVDQYTEVSRELSREQSRRDTEIRGIG